MTNIGDLLVRWAYYVVNANRGKLGYAMGGYAERVGGDAWGDMTPDIDPDLLQLDGMIKKLPGTLMNIIWTHYVVPGPVKAKLNGQSERGYFERVSIAKSVLQDLWQERLLEKTG